MDINRRGGGGNGAIVRRDLLNELTFVFGKHRCFFLSKSLDTDSRTSSMEDAIS